PGECGQQTGVRGAGCRVQWTHRHRSGHHRGALGRTVAGLSRTERGRPVIAAVRVDVREGITRGGTAGRKGRPRSSIRPRSLRAHMTYPRTSAFGPAAHRQAQGPAASPRFPEIEREILDFWKADDTFRASIAQRAEAPEWVFYDGPPFANGLPHYGHLLTGYAKDLFPRFQTMLGKKVDRVFGWDTHGLPAELEAMKQLGITEKSEIEAMGIDVF